MKSLDPHDISPREFYTLLVHTIIPRPIALASTMDEQGNLNLSPFSFFNVFGANPPILIFSPTLRGRDKSVKDTLLNIQESHEVVINLVNYAMLEQMNITSAEFPFHINEFQKSGLTPIASKKVKPPSVKESPVAFECKVLQVLETGREGIAGNLVICEILMAHFKKGIFDSEGKIDPLKLDVVGKLGGNVYCRMTPESLFELPRPAHFPMGFEQLPDHILDSKILSANDLGKLASVESLPTPLEKDTLLQNIEIQQILARPSQEKMLIIEDLHSLAKSYLANHHIEMAWQVLLLVE
jgi:flavin reductase (DIM6/NTAB) family NADH-FMN oxidoreductase RutF